MDEHIVPLLCDPESHAALELDKGMLLDPKSGRRYQVRDGIPVFFETLSGSNKKYQELYDRIARFYDPADVLYRWLFRKENLRLEYLKKLDVGPGARVLDVSVGTGANLAHLRSDSAVFGLDISWGMLKRCRKHLVKWKRTAELFQGEAERLPFRDGIFDVVFHVGGINFFNDRLRAVTEMIRVAKPGTKIVIVDETEKTVKDIYEKTPVTKKYFEQRETSVASPVDLVPQNMLDIVSKEIGEGRLYCLTFRKPYSAGSASHAADLQSHS
jgi:ubiquinone/menaquinone biosynthesis C-methylase UbiE